MSDRSERKTSVDSEATEQVTAQPAQHLRPSVMVQLWEWGSWILAGTLAIIYYFRPDSLAAATVFPIWCWTLFPVLLTLGLLIRAVILRVATWTSRSALGRCLLVWLAVTWWGADAPLAVVRGLLLPEFPQVRAETKALLRVVTLNCHDSRKAITAVARLKPDLIFVQETVSQPTAEELADELFGEESHVVWDPDVSILSRYPLTLEPLSPELKGYAIAAWIQWPQERTERAEPSKVLLINLHLSAPPFRLDLWNFACWQAFRASRETQRAELNAILSSLPDMSATTPVLLGGDFNAPPRDAIFQDMPAD